MTSFGHLFAPAVLFVVAAGNTSAQGYSLLTGGDLFSARAPLFDEARPDQPSLGAKREPLVRAQDQQQVVLATDTNWEPQRFLGEAGWLGVTV